MSNDSSIKGLRKSKLRRATTGMESSIFRFKDLNVVVGKGANEKNILSDVSGLVKWGHTLAILGPSKF